MALAWQVVVAISDDGVRNALPLLARGMAITLFITAITFGTGFLLALLLTLVNLSRRAWSGWLVTGYAAVFRNTPLIAQLYLVYYGAGEYARELTAMGVWWLFRDPLSCVVLVFVLNTAAYQVHVLRGALASLAGDQTDAARALGLGSMLTFFKVLLPQALRIAARPLSNELTQMTKASSIASTVTVFDLLSAARLAFNETLNFDVYVIAAAVYILMVEAIRRAANRVVARLSRHEEALKIPATPREYGSFR